MVFVCVSIRTANKVLKLWYARTVLDGEQALSDVFNAFVSGEFDGTDEGIDEKYQTVSNYIKCAWDLLRNSTMDESSPCKADAPSICKKARTRADKRLRRFKCNDCGQILGRIDSLKKHKMRKHPRKDASRFTCLKCSKVFTYARDLKQHMKHHVPPKVHRCLCGQGFVSKEVLAAHTKKMHTGLEFLQCKICGLKIKTAHLLNVHHRLIHEKRIFYCTQCDRSFKYKISVERHEKTVHCEETPYKCEPCGQIFKVKDRWKFHQQKCKGAPVVQKTEEVESLFLESYGKHNKLSDTVTIELGDQEDFDTNEALILNTKSSECNEKHFQQLSNDQISTCGRELFEGNVKELSNDNLSSCSNSAESVIKPSVGVTETLMKEDMRDGVVILHIAGTSPLCNDEQSSTEEEKLSLAKTVANCGKGDFSVIDIAWINDAFITDEEIISNNNAVVPLTSTALNNTVCNNQNNDNYDDIGDGVNVDDLNIYDDNSHPNYDSKQNKTESKNSEIQPILKLPADDEAILMACSVSHPVEGCPGTAQNNAEEIILQNDIAAPLTSTAPIKVCNDQDDDDCNGSSYNDDNDSGDDNNLDDKTNDHKIDEDNSDATYDDSNKNLKESKQSSVSPEIQPTLKLPVCDEAISKTSSESLVVEGCPETAQNTAENYTVKEKKQIDQILETLCTGGTEKCTPVPELSIKTEIHYEDKSCNITDTHPVDASGKKVLCDQAASKECQNADNSTCTIGLHHQEDCKCLGYKCDECGIILTRKNSLKKHKVRKHPVLDSSRFVCTRCPKSFYLEPDLRQHLKNHVSDKPHKCLCGRHFATKEDLGGHKKKMHTGRKLLKCKVCGLKLKTASLLSVHYRLLHEKREFLCAYCDRSFRYKLSVERHEKTIHSDATPYQCDRCGMQFKVSDALQRHQLSCQGTPVLPRKNTSCPSQPKYLCNFCGEVFKKNSHLTSHQIKHTGARPYKCDQCEKAFTRKQLLTQHARIHTGERPFSCDTCGKTFRQAMARTKHKRTHERCPPVLCKYCGKNFQQVSYVRDHIKRMHKLEMAEEKELAYNNSYVVWETIVLDK